MKFSILVAFLLQCAISVRSQDDGIYTIGSGCPKLTIENAEVEPALEYREETYAAFTEVTIKCNYGFITVGKESSMCMEDGTWSNIDSPCREPKPVGCEPPAIRHGFRVTRLQKGQKMFQVGDNVYVTCNDGYVRDGRAFLTCQKDGSWDDGYSSCKVIKLRTGCGEPNFPSKSGVFMPPMYGDSYEVGTKLTFKCSQGRVMIGSQYSYCQANGEWNAIPDCMPGCTQQNVKYGTISPSPNVENQYHEFGQTITLKCKAGYKLVGPKTATCRPSGIWSAFLICSDVCDAPNIPNMKTYPAKVDGKRLYKAGQNVTCKCNAGFRLQGSPIIQCLSGNRWNVEMPTCKRIFCEAPAEISIAKYRPIQYQYSYGNKIRWVCKTGYVISGAKYSSCGQNGVFIPAKPVCKVATDVKEKQPGRYVITRQACARPRKPVNGYLKPTKLYYDLAAEVEYGCKTGYIMSGTARSTCRTQGFGRETPTCTPIKCVEPSKPTNGRFATPLKKAYYYGDKVQYECAENHVMSGSAVSTCQSNAQFHPKPPTCTPPSCRYECKYVKGRSCQCNAECRYKLDCCDDFEQHCRKLFY
ncbi:sushi, von Willebrand factor type A, EGF and pentraxin domain-containing protein 1-like isoform X1 [Styela clava]